MARSIKWLMAAPFLLFGMVILIVLVLWIYSVINFHLSFYIHPEQYTSKVPAILKASKPRILVDETSMFGGYIAIKMSLDAKVGEEIKADSKHLTSWVTTPIPDSDIGAGKKAEFLQFVILDDCNGCSDVFKAAHEAGNYYFTPFAPRTTRVGILVVPSTNSIYYIESGN